MCKADRGKDGLNLNWLLYLRFVHEGFLLTTYYSGRHDTSLLVPGPRSGHAAMAGATVRSLVLISAASWSCLWG